MRAPEFWQGPGYTAKLAIAALTPLSWAYGATVAYKAANAKPYRSRAKVVCVGNLTAGGTGKTPIAIAIARRLTEHGIKPCILTRGYGGRMRGPLIVSRETHLVSDVGDEALLLAADAPVIVSRNRAAGAQLADRFGWEAIVMDDGHQNFSLAKDLSLVVVDAAVGFGNGRVLPAGPLREPVGQGLARADAIIVTGTDVFNPPPIGKPILRAQLTPRNANGLHKGPLVAFAGIGRPEKFFESLRALGATLGETHSFPDHHLYSAVEIARLKAAAEAQGAALITTGKDFVRLTSAERADIHCLPILAEFEELAALDALLDTVFRRG